MMRILVNVLVMTTSLATSVNIVHLDTNIFLTVFHVTVVQMGLLIRIVIQILDIAIVMQELKEKNVATVWMDIMIFPIVKVQILIIFFSVFFTKWYLCIRFSTLDCMCDIHGSISKSCDENGKCPCKEKYTGDKCDECIEGHYLVASFDGDYCEGKLYKVR